MPDEPPVTDLGEVVVTAKRTRAGNTTPPEQQQEVEQENGTDTGGGGGYVDPTAPPSVSHDGSDLARQAAEHFVERVDEIDEHIDALDPNARIQMPDGRVMTGAEIQALWRGMSFTFTTNGAYANNPAAAGANNNGHVEMDAARYYGYLSTMGNDEGAYYYAFHEMGHLVDTNNYSDTYNWQQHLANGGTQATYDTSGWFENNEVFANRGAAALGDSLGFGHPADPPIGYEYDPNYL